MLSDIPVTFRKLSNMALPSKIKIPAATAIAPIGAASCSKVVRASLPVIASALNAPLVLAIAFGSLPVKRSAVWSVLAFKFWNREIAPSLAAPY